MLNLILGLFWLAAAVALFAYEFATGEMVMRIRGSNISSAWFLLLLAGWNFARWYASRSGQVEQNALRIAHEERLRRARFHERPVEPDPTFDFTDKPAPPSPGFSDRPPSNN